MKIPISNALNILETKNINKKILLDNAHFNFINRITRSLNY